MATTICNSKPSRPQGLPGSALLLDPAASAYAAKRGAHCACASQRFHDWLCPFRLYKRDDVPATAAASQLRSQSPCFQGSSNQPVKALVAHLDRGKQLMRGRKAAPEGNKIALLKRLAAFLCEGTEAGKNRIYVRRILLPLLPYGSN